jgi:hypothetical protein
VTNLTIALNTDTQDLAYGSSGVEYTEINLDNDFLIFTAGSNVVKDGEPIPSASELTQAGILLNGSEQTVDLYLLADVSANELKEVHNMGDQDKRYVMAFVFDGPTASEPVLEAWDNDSMNSINNVSLGSGVATSSWLRGVVTTDGLPGPNWTGQRLAGASDGHFLKLNNDNGALSTAKTLYCNLKLVIPSVQTEGLNETPVLIVKYTTN